jgi:hypothetical protein
MNQSTNEPKQTSDSAGGNAEVDETDPQHGWKANIEEDDEKWEDDFVYDKESWLDFCRENCN